jgi:hypothetical protein
MMRRTLWLTAVLSLPFIFGSQGAKANVFQDAWGVVTDPFKLKASSENLYLTVMQLDNLEKRGNVDIRDRLNQLDEIVSRNEAQAVADVNKFEKTLYEDTSDLLRKISCVGTDLLQNDLRDAVANAVQTLADSDPSIYIGPWKIADLRGKKVQLDNPSTIYYATRDVLLDNLTKSVEATVSAGKPMPVYVIFDTYQNIERLANKATCGYPGQSLKEAEFTMEANRMELKSIPWRELADLSH